MIDKKNKSFAFFELWSSVYDWFPFGWWLRLIQRNVIRGMAERSILDVGCGTGSALKMLLALEYKNLTGVDFSPKMLTKARQKLGEEVKLIFADAAKLPFENERFDIVLSTEAFHHFPEPEKSLREIVRVLKKDGLLYLADIDFVLPPLNWLFEKIEPGCVHIYSKREIHKLLTKAGLQVIRQRRVGIFAVKNVARKPLKI